MFNLIESLNIFVSPYVVAVVTLCLYLLLAHLSDYLIKRVIKNLVTKTKTEVDDLLLASVHKPLYYSFIIIGIAHALVYLKLSENLLFYANSSLYSVVAFIWLITLFKISKYLVEIAFHKDTDVYIIPQDLFPMFRNLLKILIIGIFLVIILTIWQINVTPLLASAGILGAAIAFAAKDTLANLFGAISIFADKPFKVGDIITLDSGEKGAVISIGIRSTRIKTFDEVMITIPNSAIANAKIMNDNAPDSTVRIKIPVCVAYGTNINEVDRILIDIVQSHEDIMKEPQPRVFFMSFGDSAINLDLIFWVQHPLLRLKITNEVNRTIYNRFNEAGIKIPFPQREVYLNKSN